MSRQFPRSLVPAIFSVFLFLNVHAASAQEVAPAAPTPTPLSDDVKQKIADVQTAIRNSDSAIRAAEDRRQVADAQVNRMKRLTSSKKADEAALRDLEDLGDVIGDVDRAKFYVKNNPEDQKVLVDLGAAEQQLTAAKTALPSGGTQPPEVVAAGKDADAASKRITDEKSAVTKTRDDLRSAVSGISTFASAFPDALQKRIDPLFNLPDAAVASNLRNILPHQLPAFRAVEQLSRNLNSTWDDLSTQLKPLGIDPDTTFTQIQTKLNTLRGNLKTMQNRLVKRDDPNTATVEDDAWLVRMATGGRAQVTTLLTERDKVKQDPVTNSAAAAILLRDGAPWVDDLRSVQLEWLATQAQLAATDDLDFDPASAEHAADSLESATRAFRGALSDLQDALAGNASNFEADQISLFYFTDIPRLMQMLNSDSFENGGIKTASEEAAARRRELTNADLDLADAQSTVSTLQTKVQRLREQLRADNAAADSAIQIFKKTTLTRAGALRDKEANEKRFNDGQCDPTPTDPDKRAKCESLASERDRASTRFDEADRRNTDAEEDKKRATEKRDATRDEQNGLPAKIAEAESKLSDAQLAVNRQRRSALLAAQAESEAFVKARDNRPFWEAPVNATSSDPVKHVFLWAFNDSKTVFMRGPRADLNYVKCLIAKIDQPAPQARMTLWTLELSSDSSVGGAKKTNESLELVERHLSNSRALNAAALSVFRDAINERVNMIASEAKKQAKPTCVKNCLLNTADGDRLARLKFYHPEVLKRLGFDSNELFNSLKTDPLLARVIVPDPAGTTTLGEALMVLNLGQQQYRTDIMTLFLVRLSRQLPELGLKDLPSELGRLAEKKKSIDITWFPSLRRAIDLDGFIRSKDGTQEKLTRHQLESLRNLLAGSPDSQARILKQMAQVKTLAEQFQLAKDNGISDGQLEIAGYKPNAQDLSGLSASQLEILHAMEQVAQENLLKYLKVLIKRYIQRRREMAQKQLEAGVEVTVPVCPTVAEFNKMATQARTVAEQLEDEKARKAEIEKNSKVIQQKAEPGTMTITQANAQSEALFIEIEALKNDYCATSIKLREVSGKLEGMGVTWDWIKKYADAQTSATPADAAKSESEFDHQIWANSCAGGLRTANAREAAADQMLKEMIIAVEDDLDRVFVQPMLQSLRKDLQRKGIGVGILQRTSVLATNRLLARVEPRASAQLPLGQETDVLQAAQQLSEIFFAAQGGGPLGALGALQSLPRAPQAELYGLTTGNVFQVTPVFDPSGQALRFRFDYILQSMIQEPNGTVNPQLPRIERHTVNTEVQLSNLELREISRYESNARLGIATRYAGGLPIFKDIPYIRYIPVIGWFVRTSGKAAVTQESLIFGQTTMYPTIGDIMGLLTTEPTVDISREP
jgi:hypothetical protein